MLWADKVLMRLLAVSCEISFHEKKLCLPKIKSALEHRFVMCVQFLVDKDYNFFFSTSATSEKSP